MPWYRNQLLIFAFSLGATSACTHRIPFENAMRHRHDLDREHQGEARIHRLQFFSSDRIVLERVLRSGESQVARGKLISRKGKRLERIVVWQGTPGVARSFGAQWIDVAFSKDSHLRFRLARDGAYYLETLPGKDGVEVRFKDKRWKAIGASRHANLRIRRTAFGRYDYRQRRLGGQRVKK